MALSVTAATDRITYTAPLMGDPCTLLAWCKPNTVSATFRQIAGQISTTGQWRWATGNDNGTGVLRLFLAGSTSLNYISDSGFIVVDVWNYIAFVADTSEGDGDRGRIYRGDLSTDATEVTYATVEEPISLFSTNSDLEIGVDGDGSGFSFDGHIAMISVWPGTALTLAQIVEHQLDTVPKVAGNGIWTHFQGGQAVNWSGASAAVNGTITGATESNHVPLPRILRRPKPRYEDEAAAVGAGAQLIFLTGEV